MKWVNIEDGTPSDGNKWVVAKMRGGSIKETKISPALKGWNLRNIEKWIDESESSPITSDKERDLKTRIVERKLCIYIIEQDLMDHEEVEPYDRNCAMALKDEIENHKSYIADYEEELNKTQKEE
jgi:hypothetical protein